jgi:hypothetical protein
MEIIPEDVRDDRDVLSMTDLLALVDILPPETCHPNALCTAFHSYFSFGDTNISTKERTRWATTMKAIAEAQQVPSSQSITKHDITCDATPDSQTTQYLREGFVPEETQTTLPAAGHGIIPTLPPPRGQDRAVSFQDTLADHVDSDINSPIESPASRYDEQPPSRAMAFHSPFKLSASRMNMKEANDKKDGSNGNKKKKKEYDLFISNALETESHFRVALSVAALLIFFMTRTSKTRQPRVMLSRTATITALQHYHTCGSTSC